MYINSKTMVDLHQPGFEFHRLVPTARHAVKVSGPWRITFEWLGGYAVAVDLEQYH